MANLAMVTIIGYLSKDPESKTFGDKKVVNISIPVSETTGTGDNKTEKTSWYNVSLWGRDGEFAEKYLKKGNMVQVIGDLTPRTYTDSAGKEKTSLDVRGTKITNLSPKATGGEDQPY